MFDQYSRDLIDQLPSLPGLDPVACRRALSRAYLLVVDRRLSYQNTPALVGASLTLQVELYRLVAALESVAIFDPLHGLPVSSQVRAASAFVAAEALSLLSELSDPPPLSAEPYDPVQRSAVYSLLESALLYMVGGYDINAVAVARRLPDLTFTRSAATYFDQRCERGVQLVERIRALCLGDIRHQPTPAVPPGVVAPTLLADIQDDARAHLYAVLTDAVDHYLRWLRGDDGVDQALLSIDRAIRACHLPDPPDGFAPSPFADILHLGSLLAAAITSTRERSVVHGVPLPNDGAPEICEAFPRYLRDRALGPHTGQGRPFLWPSTLEYVREALPGPRRDAVVSMPTGSGKSFLAELAVAHAIATGWVVYLAPTNALVHQIQRDLAAALRSFHDVTVSAFVGGEEYTTLADERVTAESVVVMTPEKCALALRLRPDLFATCSLCVFDECHLLNDPSRGVVADVLLAQLFHSAPRMRVLLMSAMVSNTDELAGWLTSVRGTDARALDVKWRPSRTARGFVFVDQPEEARLAGEAKSALDATRGAGFVPYTVPLAWIVGLSGPWTHDGVDDFRVGRLPATAAKVRSRTRKNVTADTFVSWKNRTGRELSVLFASRGIPTIDFLLSSKHHAFSCANDVTQVLPAPAPEDTLPSVVDAYLGVADAELGVESALRQLLRRGIAVHTSALLRVEQAAAEHMFGKGHVKLMFATGTLAQGLNLPAVAVVVSGSELGNPKDFRKDFREADAGAGITRASELILNGFGRAGRPGFSNQGFVVLVSNEPYLGAVSSTVDGASVLKHYAVLAEPDAAITVHSPLEELLDELLNGEAANEDAGRVHPELIPLLSASDTEDENAGKILQRTFAGYRKRAVFTPDRAAVVTGAIGAMKARFLDSPAVPAWMPTAALKAGVDFIHAQRFWEAYQRRGVVSPELAQGFGVLDWFDVLIDVLSRMPAVSVTRYMSSAKTTTARTKLLSLAPSQTGAETSEPSLEWSQAWKELGSVARAYIAGRPFTEIGAALMSCEPTGITSSRSGRGLPGVFKFLVEVVDRALSLDAGCLLAIHECWLEAAHPEIVVPEPLQGLPLCVRNGCSSLDVLAWFRFGLRQRTCAHALALAFPRAATSEFGRREFVERTRYEWMRSKAEDRDPLLRHARTIIAEAAAGPR